MVTRLISATASEIKKMDRADLKQAIKASEGRVICSENIIIYKPLCDCLTNAEIDKAMGADLILLNFFDVLNPFINGLNPADDSDFKKIIDEDAVRKLKEYVGRPIGLNLEPINEKATMLTDRQIIANGRTVTKENLLRANDLGFDFLCITGNPKTGVDNANIVAAIKLAKEYFKGLIFAGKMHSSGVDEAIINLKLVKEFIKSGADVILVPAVGTIQGLTGDLMLELCTEAHRQGALVMSTIGTSQEGSTKNVISDIALQNKMYGVDIQHIGDLSRKENIFTMSMAIRGERHTYNRMAQSIMR